LAIDIIAEVLTRVNIKVVFVSEHQDKLDDLLSKGEPMVWPFWESIPNARKPTTSAIPIS